MSLLALRLLAAATLICAIGAAPAAAQAPDTTPPDITVTFPVEGQEILSEQGALPTSFTCDDGPDSSGVDGCECTDAGGSLIYTCSGTGDIETPNLGPATFTVVAIDTAGNRTTRSVPYLVDPAGGGTTSGGDGSVKLTLKPAGGAARKLLRGHAKLSLHVFVTIDDGHGPVARKDAIVVVRR